MDPALRALADHVEATAEAPIGVRLALTSGHTVSGTLIPNGDLEPVVMGRIDQSLRRGPGRKKAAPVTEAPDDDAIRALKKALSTPAGDDALTVGRVTLEMPGGGAQSVPVVRVDGSQVSAWWIFSDGPA